MGLSRRVQYEPIGWTAKSRPSTRAATNSFGFASEITEIRINAQGRVRVTLALPLATLYFGYVAGILMTCLHAATLLILYQVLPEAGRSWLGEHVWNRGYASQVRINPHLD